MRKIGRLGTRHIRRRQLGFFVWPICKNLCIPYYLPESIHCERGTKQPLGHMPWPVNNSQSLAL